MSNLQKPESVSRGPLPWSVTVAIGDVPEHGKHFDLAAPEDALPTIAKLAGVAAVSFLQATLDVTRLGDGLHLAGNVRAEVEQACVVTLEPLRNKVDETVDVSFSASNADFSDEIAVSLDPASAEPPEVVENGVVDLAAVAVEFLLLGIDPYPRKDGAQFETAIAGNPEIEPVPHPFAALEALKKRDEGQDR
jgi:uncharacterized metal-binding protein YceD (DUF177 family)